MKPTRAELTKEFWWNHIDPEKLDFENVFEPIMANVSDRSGKKIGEIPFPNPLIGYWDFGRDFAAYAYELARRVDRKLKLKAYPQLSPEESQFLFRTFGDNKSRKTYELSICNVDPKLPLESRIGYSQPAIWKLDAPKNTLVTGFLWFIEQQQKLNGIKPRKTPGDTSKNPPWQYVELLDEVELLGEKPNGGRDPERMLRRAKRDAKKHLQTFKSQLKKEEGENPNLRACYWPELDRLLLK